MTRFSQTYRGRAVGVESKSGKLKIDVKKKNLSSRADVPDPRIIHVILLYNTPVYKKIVDAVTFRDIRTRPGAFEIFYFRVIETFVYLLSNHTNVLPWF